MTALCGRGTGFIEEDLEDVATVALEFDNGVHACLHMGYLLSRAGPRTTPILDCGEHSALLRGSPPARATSPLTASHRVGKLRRNDNQYGNRKTSGICRQWGFEFVTEFVHAIRQGDKTTVSIHDAYRVMQIIDASYESSRTGRRIELT